MVWLWIMECWFKGAKMGDERCWSDWSHMNLGHLQITRLSSNYNISVPIYIYIDTECNCVKIPVQRSTVQCTVQRTVQGRVVVSCVPSPAARPHASAVVRWQSQHEHTLSFTHSFYTQFLHTVTVTADTVKRQSVIIIQAVTSSPAAVMSRPSRGPCWL